MSTLDNAQQYIYYTTSIYTAGRIRILRIFSEKKRNPANAGGSNLPQRALPSALPAVQGTA